MAGEIEEPIRHDFEAGSFLSGSISFGRFENEVLCWERRSSFSQNRYLEEVEKCSKPGSVTEKKAYFEAHFRKKGILPQSSTESTNEIENYQTSENEKTGYDEDIDIINATSNSETCFERSCDIEVKENLNGEESNLDTVRLSNVTIGPFGDDHEPEGNSGASAKSEQGSSSKEKIPPQIEHTKSESARQVCDPQSTRYMSNNSSKGSEEIASKTGKNVLMRSKAENKTLEASAWEKQPIHKTPNYELVTKAKGISDIKRSEKLSRNRRIEEPRASTLKDSSKVHQRANRIKSAVGTPHPCVKQDNCRLSFKCNERAERRVELDMKSEEKKHAKEAKVRQLLAKTQEKTGGEIKQLRKTLHFKATPLPAFYRRAQRDSDKNKATVSNTKPRNIRTNSSSIGTRVSESSRLSSIASKDEAVFSIEHPKTSDPPYASGATSCHSTVTSDSTPSSPAAVITNSQAVIKSQVGQKKENENEKRTRMRKHKGPEVKKTNRGKMMDGKEKKRTERTIYAAFTNSSRTGH